MNFLGDVNGVRGLALSLLGVLGSNLSMRLLERLVMLGLIDHHLVWANLVSSLSISLPAFSSLRSLRNGFSLTVQLSICCLLLQIAILFI